MQCSVYVEIKINPFINICQRRYYLVPTTLPPCSLCLDSQFVDVYTKPFIVQGHFGYLLKALIIIWRQFHYLKNPIELSYKPPPCFSINKLQFLQEYNVAKHCKALPMIVRSDGSEKSCLHFELRNVILFLKWRNEGNAKRGGQWIIMKQTYQALQAVTKRETGFLNCGT